MRGLRGLLLAAMFVLAAQLVGHAQAVNGTLLGTITDSTGATAAAATVTATETRTNIVVTTTTNQDGNYVFANLRNGVYRVEASRPVSRKWSGITWWLTSTRRSGPI